MKQIKKSLSEMCADSTSCFPTWQQKPHKLKWLADRLLYKGITNEGEIILTPVTIATDYHATPYMMDAVTGSLYKGKQCITSTHLVLESIKDCKGLDKVLLAMRNNKVLGV